MEYEIKDHQFSMLMTREERARLAELASSVSRSAADYLRLRINEDYERLLADGHKEREVAQ